MYRQFDSVNVEDPTITWTDQNMIELPLVSNVKCLSGPFDDSQAYVIPDQKSYVLVILKKVNFKEKAKFISGCSVCFNLNSDFLLYLEASKNYDSANGSFAQCIHIRSALSEILNNFHCWKSTISIDEIQEFLTKNCVWENESNFFVTLKTPDFCGSLSSSEGIILFIKKKQKWRCGACQFKIAQKCRHGQNYIFPDEVNGNDVIVIEKEDDNIFENKSQMISNDQFSGE